jgi:hypothetical protein
VSYLDNGTVIKLAKVAGSPNYMALMERLMQTSPSPYGRCFVAGRCGVLGYWRGMMRLVRRSVGLPATSEAAILAEMVARLKVASEAAMQTGSTGSTSTKIKNVAVTAPWQPVWRDDISSDCDLNDALVLAGLEPWTYETGEPIYQGEIHAVLAANGRWLCQPYGCGDEDEDDVIEGIFFIRLV